MSTDTRHIAIYLRVSTTGQDHASQEADLKRWAAALPEDEPVKFYRDKFTGTSMDRPGFGKLMDQARRGKVSKVVAWRLDRLGRTARGLTELFDELRNLKVTLVSLRDGIDLATPSGRMMANVLASVAQFETEVRGERIRAGIAAAKDAGKSWGGSKPGRMLKVNTEQVDLIHRMKAEGKSVSSIARMLKVSRPTIYKWLEHQPARTLNSRRQAARKPS